MIIHGLTLEFQTLFTTVNFTKKIIVFYCGFRQQLADVMT